MSVVPLLLVFLHCLRFVRAGCERIIVGLLLVTASPESLDSPALSVRLGGLSSTHIEVNDLCEMIMAVFSAFFPLPLSGRLLSLDARLANQLSTHAERVSSGI